MARHTVRHAAAVLAALAWASSLTAQLFGVRPDREPSEPVILRTTVAPETVYVGQPVRLAARFLFSEHVQRRLRRAPEYELPSPGGFWVRELPETGPRVRWIDDVAYDERLFRRLYFPLRPGSHTLPPVRLYYETRSDFLGPVERHTLASDSIRVFVRPVPSAGRPPSFTGAVGRFEIRARLEPDRVDAGGAAVLTVEVEGRGNVKTLPPPALPEIAGARVYPPTESADARLAGDGVVGTKRFRWVIVPERAGSIDVGPVAYGYFDAERGAFDVARAPAMTLDVEGVATVDTRAIRPLKPMPSPDRWGWLRSPVVATLLTLPLLGLLGTIGVRRRRQRSRGPAPRTLRRRRRRAFAALAQRADDRDRTFFADVERAFRHALADRLADATLRTAAPDRLRDAVGAAGADDRSARGAEALVIRLERARYAPDPPGSDVRSRYVHAARRILDDLDHAAEPRPGRPPGEPPIAIVALGLAAAALAAAAVAARPPTPAAAPAASIRNVPPPGTPAALQAEPRDGDLRARFHAGVTAYATGEYERAAEHFRAVVDARPRDAHAWYNLGNAHFRLDRPGVAIHAWLHAVRLTPRDADTRHNLAVAEAPAATVRRARPWLPLSAGERGFAAAVLWLLGSSLAFAGVVRRRRRLRRLAALAILPAAVLGATLAFGRLRPPAFVVLDAMPLRAAPIHRATPVRELAPGTLVRGEERRGEWLRVTARGGAQGWVAIGRVGRL